MDISDLTSNESPRELKVRKEFIPEYCREALRCLESCVTIVEKAVKDNGLTMEWFHELRVKNANDLTKDELNQMRSIRESIKVPTKDTIFQKAISKSRFEEYLNEHISTVGGFVACVQDIKDLNTYADYYESLRLDYEPPDFLIDTDNSMYVIRFKTYKIDSLIVPYNKCLKGKRDYKPPCTGHGFTGALNSKIIPEYRFTEYIELDDGAEIYEITKDGEEILRAIYYTDYNEFRLI